jgi:hypothetical protein
VFTEGEHGIIPVVRRPHKTLDEEQPRLEKHETPTVLVLDHMVIRAEEPFELRLELPTAAVLEENGLLMEYYRAEINYASKNQSFGLDRNFFPSWQIMSLQLKNIALIREPAINCINDICKVILLYYGLYLCDFINAEK